jgi:hypothetical protein
VINNFSVSQISSFNVEEEGCELRWFYKSILKRPEPQKEFNTVGIEVHAQLKHHGTTGEDVLGKIARAGAHLLPFPGGEVLREWGLNDKPQPVVDGKALNWFLDSDGGAKSSFVWAAEVPLVGFMDLVDPRPQHRLSDGRVIEEPNTIEVLDYKTTGDVKKWAKPAEKLIQTTQMTGYGMFVAKRYPWATHVRLSHLTFSTKSSYAQKETIVHPIAEIKERWYGAHGVETIANRMKVVAGLREEDVEGNFNACGAFGGCAHRSYCAAHKKLSPFKRIQNMGLLKNRTTPAPAALPPAATNGAVATNTPWIGGPTPPTLGAPAAPAKPRLQIQDAPSGFTAAQAIAGPTYITQAGAQVTLTGEATPGWRIFTPVGGGAPQVLEATAALTIFVPPAAPVAVREPDAPPPPPSLGSQVAATSTKRGPGRPKGSKKDTAVSTEAEASGLVADFHLYVNAVPNGPFQTLDAYINDLTTSICEEHKTSDIRATGGDSPLAFGRWRGVLASLVRNEWPAAGTYVVLHSTEVTDVVVEALIPLCAPGAFIRGVATR